MAPPRQFDIILLGATGYTGLIVAEYFHQHLPSTYKWAIAGRSQSKLKDVNSALKAVSSSRTLPEILVASLDPAELTNLANKARLIVNCVGPYYLYCTPVVQACAETGTHYIDVTGETPWVRNIIAKFEASAKKSGSILIPSCGLESAQSDVLAYVATKLVRDVWDCGVMDMVGSVHELKVAGPSGGTLATGLGLMDAFSFSEFREAMRNPFCLSPLQLRDHRHTKVPVPISYERSMVEKITGVWSYPYLGTLTTSITSAPNMAVVQRSAALMQTLYSYNFTYEEYMRASSALVGYLIHFAIMFISSILMFPPIRMIAKSLATKPGSGPARGVDGYCELRGVAVAEQLNKQQRKALASVRLEKGSMYEWTAILVCEGSVAMLEGMEDLKARFGNGAFLTPACLGDRYVKRLEDAGVKITVKQIGDVGSK